MLTGIIDESTARALSEANIHECEDCKRDDSE